ncbi:response regulator transcription factor [Paralysiella testudinis]|uniref:Response regulator n=1 Tax=Paralysiella testudinis TaxID=2809020 RepID=A0A892ZJ67_9NEIS|nr:response regulator [Paralysiella testudinis]QRQ81584.1 response regulator [Paralysiella testudinis]
MKHFLLVDDDEIFAHLLQRGFGRHGLTLDWAANSDAALAYQGQPDGIILDLNLGGDSGLQLLPRLVQQFPASKIVVLTGYASISTAVSAVKLGACQYLPKPADVATLLQAFGNDNTTVAEDNQQTPIAEQGPSLQRLKWEHIQFVLQQHQGNISATARALNMHRRTLQRMLAKHPVKK